MSNEDPVRNLHFAIAYIISAQDKITTIAEDGVECQETADALNHLGNALESLSGHNMKCFMERWSKRNEMDGKLPI